MSAPKRYSAKAGRSFHVPYVAPPEPDHLATARSMIESPPVDDVEPTTMRGLLATLAMCGRAVVNQLLEHDPNAVRAGRTNAGAPWYAAAQAEAMLYLHDRSAPSDLPEIEPTQLVPMLAPLSPEDCRTRFMLIAEEVSFLLTASRTDKAMAERREASADAVFGLAQELRTSVYLSAEQLEWHTCPLRSLRAMSRRQVLAAAVGGRLSWHRALPLLNRIRPAG